VIKPPRRVSTTSLVRQLGRLSGGWSTAQIAEAMSLTDNTVRTRIRRLERKMVVTGRDSAVRRAHDLGIA
jgi:DNA-binding NarL/FixJ family response regulator